MSDDADRWEKTSFADSTEAAIHHAMVHFTLEVAERDRTQGKFADLSDIYIRYRRLIRDIVEGRVDPDEYLKSLEEGA